MGERERSKEFEPSRFVVNISRIEDPKKDKGRGGVCIKIESRASSRKLSERLVR